MNKQINKTRISSLAPLLLFVVFTTCVLSVLLTGADIYQKFSERDRNIFLHRTAAQYLSTRVRQNDMAGMLFVGDFDNNPDVAVPAPERASASEISGDTLFLKEELGERTFYTRIYCADGYLQELFAEAGLEFTPSMGVKVLELEKLYYLQNYLKL